MTGLWKLSGDASLDPIWSTLQQPSPPSHRCAQGTITRSRDEAAAHDAAVLAYNNPYLQESDWWTRCFSRLREIPCLPNLTVIKTRERRINIPTIQKRGVNEWLYNEGTREGPYNACNARVLDLLTRFQIWMHASDAQLPYYSVSSTHLAIKVWGPPGHLQGTSIGCETAKLTGQNVQISGLRSTSVDPRVSRILKLSRRGLCLADPPPSPTTTYIVEARQPHNGCNARLEKVRRAKARHTMGIRISSSDVLAHIECEEQRLTHNSPVL